MIERGSGAGCGSYKEVAEFCMNSSASVSDFESQPPATDQSHFLDQVGGNRSTQESFGICRIFTIFPTFFFLPEPPNGPFPYCPRQRFARHDQRGGLT